MNVEMKVEYNPGETGGFLDVDKDKCTGCGRCATFCTRDVWVKQGSVYSPLNLNQCVECGACWNVCDDDAVIFGEPRGGTGVRFAYG
jgi:ferredoxin like protein